MRETTFSHEWTSEIEIRGVESTQRSFENTPWKISGISSRIIDNISQRAYTIKKSQMFYNIWKYNNEKNLQ